MGVFGDAIRPAELVQQKTLTVGHDVSDKKSLKQVAMTDVHIVEEILRRWDPIGVRPNVDGGPP
jgi:hypothetical protein